MNIKHKKQIEWTHLNGETITYDGAANLAQEIWRRFKIPTPTTQAYVREGLRSDTEILQKRSGVSESQLKRKDVRKAAKQKAHQMIANDIQATLDGNMIDELLEDYELIREEFKRAVEYHRRKATKP